MRNFLVLFALVFCGFNLIVPKALAADAPFASLSPEIQQATIEEERSRALEAAILSANFAIPFAGSQPARCVNQDSCVSDYDLLVSQIATLYYDQRLKKVDVENWLDWLQEKNNVTEADLIHFVWTFKDTLNEEWTRVFAELYRFAESGQYALNFMAPKIKHILEAELVSFNFVPVDTNRLVMARDLVAVQPNVSGFKNGEFESALRLYMFCRDDRRFPCLMVMKNAKGQLYREASGKIWSHQLLAFSRHDKKYNMSSGNTPAGLYTIDGVMPAADRKADFGQWRRLIMNFIPPSNQEVILKSLLPASSHEAYWWQESIVARDMGRNAFRVHGTKQPAPRGEPYFPFYGTSGCIANRENTYDGVTYKEQRTLLDVLMKQLQLKPVFANETKIKALLYVMNIDNAQKWVSLQDLVDLGIVK